MQMFGGKFNFAEEEMFNDGADERPRCNFDDFINACLTIFQVIIASIDLLLINNLINRHSKSKIFSKIA
jgi:hypothetical protein